VSSGQVSAWGIALQLGISYKSVQRAIKRIEAQRIRQIQRSPAEMGRQYRLANRFIEDSMARRIRRDKKGQLVMKSVEGDPTPQPVTIPLTYAEVHEVFQELEWIRKLFLEAPVTRKSRRASRRR
jgi:hypothetical protein